VDSWGRDEDRWDEGFEFNLRLFSSLAGLVADQLCAAPDMGGHATGLSSMGFWFLKDMTDLFDMFMLTFADVGQMNEGRPLLEGVKAGYRGYQFSFHSLSFTFIALGVGVVFLRALPLLGREPVVCIFKAIGKKLGCRPKRHHLRRPIDAFFSLVIIEMPFLFLRGLAWLRYGVPVSVMAVKNVLGIFEDLTYLGILHGFDGANAANRGFRLCCKKRKPKDGDKPEDTESSITIGTPGPGTLLADKCTQTDGGAGGFLGFRFFG